MHLFSYVTTATETRVSINTLVKVASLTSQCEEPGEPAEGEGTGSSSPRRVIWSHSQQRADYVHIFMEGGDMSVMGEDRSAPLIMEVFFHSMSSVIMYSIIPSCPMHVLYHSSSYFQALQKICLANHICSMVDLLHADAMQQIEVALLGSPVAGNIDLLVTWDCCKIPIAINTNCTTSLSLHLHTFGTSSPSHSNCGSYQFGT